MAEPQLVIIRLNNTMSIAGTRMSEVSPFTIKKKSLLAIAQQIGTIRKVERGVNCSGSSGKMCC